MQYFVERLTTIRFIINVYAKSTNTQIDTKYTSKLLSPTICLKFTFKDQLL